jgi:septum site-determining protein MinC
MPPTPANPSSGAITAPFELKSTRWALLALMVKTTDLTQLAQALQQQFGPNGDSPDFFDQDAVLIDVSAWPTPAPTPDLAPLLTMLKACRLVPVAIRGADESWLGMTDRLGLAQAEADVVRPMPDLEVSVPVVSSEPVPPNVAQRAAPVATMVIDKPLRSGQKVYARGSDLVVLAMVNQGAEVVADGNIHVYAPLRGKAMAGASGNVHARIFSLCLEPELISIAGVYRTSENPLPAAVHGKPAQVQLSTDGQDRLLINALTISY